MSFQLVLFPVKLNTIHSLNLLHSILLLGLLVHAPAHIHAYENFTPMPPFGSVTSYYLLIILVTWLISARQSNSGHLNCLNIYINISSNIVLLITSYRLINIFILFLTIYDIDAWYSGTNNVNLRDSWYMHQPIFDST